MKEPFGFFGVVGIAAVEHVAVVIDWPRLGLTAAQHAQYGQADGLGGQSRRPLVGEDRQADMAVAVDVRVLGYVRSEEHDARRVERIPRRKLELESKGLALVERAGRSCEVYYPDGEVALDGVAIDAHARHRISHEVGQLFLESLRHLGSYGHTNCCLVSLAINDI